MKIILKKLFDYLHTLADENTLHFLAGSIVALLTTFCLWLLVKWNGFATSLFLIPYFSFPFISVICVAIAAGWKEIWWDGRMKMGTPSKMDFKMSMYGGILTAIILWVIILVLKLVPSDGPLIKYPTKEEEFKKRLEQIHSNDPQSFDNESIELKQRSDSLMKILYEKSKKEND